MKRIVIAGGVAWCLVGCANHWPAPYEPSFQSALGYESKLVVPSTLPLVPLVTPESQDMAPRPGRRMQRIIMSRAEMEAFWADLPRSEPLNPDLPPAPGVTLPALPPLLANVDFDKYQVVAYAEVGLQGFGTARIVGIEEHVDMRGVHTVHWVGHQSPGSTSAPRSSLHMVAVARSAKMLSFVQTRQEPLPTPSPPIVAPSPQVGMPPPAPVPIVAAQPTDFPRWRTIPNPELTQAAIEAQARAQLWELSVSSLSVERQTFAWVAEHLGLAVPAIWVPESEVWVVRAEGGPTRIGPDGHTRVPVSGVEPRQVTLLLSIENGRPFATIGL